MACWYRSTTQFHEFTDADLLEKALEEIGPDPFTVNGLIVSTENRAKMDALKQNYKVKEHIKTAKKQGYWTKTRTLEDGRVEITLRK